MDHGQKQGGDRHNQDEKDDLVDFGVFYQHVF
jgi:hypothetical protein